MAKVIIAGTFLAGLAWICTVLATILAAKKYDFQEVATATALNALSLITVSYLLLWLTRYYEISPLVGAITFGFGFQGLISAVAIKLGIIQKILSKTPRTAKDEIHR